MKTLAVAVDNVSRNPLPPLHDMKTSLQLAIFKIIVLTIIFLMLLNTLTFR